MFYIWLVCLNIFCLILSAPAPTYAKTNWHKTPTTYAQEPTKKTAQKTTQIERVINKQEQQSKEWNIIIYIAGNNNLYSFIDENLRQLMTIGSNDRINIIVQVDKFGTYEVSRSLVHKGKLETYWKASNFLLSERAAHPEKYNSGALPNFIDFVQSALEQFPAEKNCLIIWNHGSGSWDPNRWRKIMFNASGEITRDNPQKGMAFNDNYHFFLSNQDLTLGLTTICNNALGGKPFDLLGLDICHGGQLEIASQVKGLAKYLVASQEVELGSGWNYARALEKLSKGSRSPTELAIDIITGYREEYINITPDYTLALYDLTNNEPNANTERSYFEQLEESLNSMSIQLIALLQSQHGKIIRKIISDTRNKRNLCCDFYSGEYIDLHLFLLSLQGGMRQLLNLHDFRYKHQTTTKQIQDLIITLTKSIDLLYKVVPNYTAGIAFSGNPIRARGISIAFPERIIPGSYAKTIFAQNNRWFQFLKEFLSKR